MTINTKQKMCVKREHCTNDNCPFQHPPPSEKPVEKPKLKPKKIIEYDPYPVEIPPAIVLRPTVSQAKRKKRDHKGRRKTLSTMSQDICIIIL
jgi:hypothetical protein